MTTGGAGAGVPGGELTSVTGTTATGGGCALGVPAAGRRRTFGLLALILAGVGLARRRRN